MLGAGVGIAARVATALLVGAVSAALAGCGDDDGPEAIESQAGSTTVAAESSPDLERYCAEAERHLEITAGIDVSSVDSMLDGFEASAAAAQSAANAAPSEVREPLAVIAEAAAELSRRLRASQPVDMDELQAAAESVIAELEGTYGDLEAEAAHVEEFDSEHCGLTFE